MARPLLASATLALVVGSLAGCGGGAGGSPGPTATSAPEPTSASPSPSPSPTGTASPSPAPAAGHLAAVTADGEVVLIDVETGERTGTLADGIDVSDPAANAIDMTADGRTVFVNRPEAGGPGEIVRLHVDGGEPEVVVRGRALAVSPDGATLAYTLAENGVGPDPAIVLHDLGSGEESTLRSQGDYAYIGELTWTADGSELAFMAGEAGTGISLVEPAAGSLDAARRLGPADPATSWRASAAMDEGRLAVVAVEGGPTDPAVWTVRVVDVETGEVLAEPLPRDRVEAGPIDSRPGEPGLLLVEAAGPGGGTLLHWDGADGLRELADGIVTAAW